MKLDDESGKEGLIKFLVDLVDIANKVSDKTSFREVAFEVVLTALVEDFMSGDHDCDDDGIDQVRGKRKWKKT